MSKAQGCGNNDRALFVMACMTGMADSPPDSPEQEKKIKVPSLCAGAKTTGLPVSTAMRKFKRRKKETSTIKEFEHKFMLVINQEKEWIQKNYS